MAKRSNFEKKDRDLYLTPFHAVVPLFAHLPQFGGTFYEPCAADGVMASHFDGIMDCVGMSDIVPLCQSVKQRDIFDLEAADINADMAITNPPWTRDIMHAIIDHFIKIGVDCWLLFDAGWIHTLQSKPYQPYLHTIVSVGRVKWFNGKSGYDDCAWYLFKPTTTQQTIIHGRST